MKTSKPISDISYNTAPYLEQVLNELLRNKIISFWVYIFHINEDDEAGKKDHFHFYMEPAKMLQTVQLTEMFKEPDPTNSKPLGVNPIWRISNSWTDWYLYALHDEAYLKMKGEPRKFHYKQEDFKYSDEAGFIYKVRTMHMEYKPVERMKGLIKAGMGWEEMVMGGLVPPGNFSNMQKMYWTIKRAMHDSGMDSIEPPSPRMDSMPVNQDLPFNGEISTGKLIPPPAPAQPMQEAPF